jgi:hypothetical protein
VAGAPPWFGCAIMAWQCCIIWAWSLWPIPPEPAVLPPCAMPSPCIMARQCSIIWAWSIWPMFEWSMVPLWLAGAAVRGAWAVPLEQAASPTIRA